MHDYFHKNIKLAMFSNVIIGNVSRAPNQHIRMISEELCDTEDCIQKLTDQKHLNGNVSLSVFF